MKIGGKQMAYSRFFDSDIYIYSHIDGYIECCACWLNDKLEDYSLFGLSEKITNDEQLIAHLEEHAKVDHNMPENLLQEILADRDRYGRLES
jgi:hypothetical protein